MNNETKKGKLVPELRFTGFEGEWEMKKFGELCKTITPSLKLQSSNYLKAGKYPIVDQSQSLICGWTNDSKGLISNVPVIIFGDHTCVLKYIDFPFIQGADGVKILSPQSGYDSRFIYQSFLANPVIQDGYKRHFSEFKEKTYMFPSLPEQQKIAECLSSVDDLIQAEADQLQALKDHKKGLMQQLFPQEGETTPKLRFPGFEGKWEEKKLGNCFEIGSGRDYKHLSKGNIPVYGSGGYMCSVNDYLFDGDSACIGRKGTINNPVLLHGKFWTVDTLFYTYDYVNTTAYFVYLLFQNINWMKHNEAGGVPSLSKTIIKSIKVYLPSLPEQQKIASCLSSLDEGIAAQQEKVEVLKEHKKGLMQKLFPSV